MGRTDSLPPDVQQLAAAFGETDDVVRLCFALQHDVEVLHAALMQLRSSFPPLTEAAATSPVTLPPSSSCASPRHSSHGDWKSWLLSPPPVSPAGPSREPDVGRGTPDHYDNWRANQRALDERDLLTERSFANVSRAPLSDSFQRVEPVVGSSAQARGLAFRDLNYEPLNLPAHRHSPLQRELLPLALRGRSVVATAGRHSGRSTSLRLFLELIADFSLQHAQLIVVASEASASKVRRQLNYFASLRRCFIVEDTAYRVDPERALPPHELAVPPSVLAVIGNTADLVASSACDVARRARPSQLLFLLDAHGERSTTLAATVAAAAGLDPRAQIAVSPRHVFRDAMLAAGGLGCFLFSLPEQKKFAGLQRLLQQLFDRPLTVLVCSTRRRIERVTELLNVHVPCVAAFYKAPESINAANLAMKRAAPVGEAAVDSPALRQRLCVVCDVNTVAQLALLGSADLLCYFDIPAPASSMQSHRNILLRGEETETVVACFAAEKDERLLALQLHIPWLFVDL